MLVLEFLNAIKFIRLKDFLLDILHEQGFMQCKLKATYDTGNI